MCNKGATDVDTPPPAFICCPYVDDGPETAAATAAACEDGTTDTEVDGYVCEIEDANCCCC